MAGYAFYYRIKKMKNMKDDKLKYMSDVIRRLLWGEPTEEEREQWTREVEEAHCGEVLERLSDESYVDKRLAGYKAWDEKEAFRRFVEEVERIKKRRLMRRRMAWSAVAAGVACLVGVALLLVPERQVKTLRDTVMSLRLDAVLAGGFSLSRTRAAELIRSGRVQVNHQDCLKADRTVAQGDVLTVRGLGRCVLREVGGLSKKGRTAVTLERYL